MIEFDLSQGLTTLISDEDADLAKARWAALRNPNYGSGGKFTVARHVRRNNSWTTEYLHRVILSRILGRELNRGEETDHINGNTLDNQRSNIRLASRQQNNWNKGANKKNTSGIQGVSWDKKNENWRARITVNGRYIHIGSFANIDDARIAREKAAIEYFGAFSPHTSRRNES